MPHSELRMETSEGRVLANLIEIPTFVEDRGRLGVVEDRDLPFEIRRIYYLYDIPEQQARGGHGHIALQQCFICMSGAVTIVVDDGSINESFRLSMPSRGLLVPAMRWRNLVEFSPGAVVVVLASAPFDPDDYVHDYDQFVSIAKAGWSQS